MGFQTKFLESGQPGDYETDIDALASKGYNVIITVGPLMSDASASKAKQYPDIKSAIVDNAYFEGGLTNVTSLMFAEDQVGFLAGVLAAGMSKSGFVCSVSNMQTPQSERYVKSFRGGAVWQAGTNIKTMNYYINIQTMDNNVPSFTGSPQGKETTLKLIGKSCDVLFGVGGDAVNGVLLAAWENNLPAISADVDEYNIYPEVQSALIQHQMIATNCHIQLFHSRSYQRLTSFGHEEGFACTCLQQRIRNFLASFQLVGAMNPCPCGYYGDPVKPCTCSNMVVSKYQKRISGPLLDRIDIHVEVPRVEYEKLSEARLGESSATVRARVEAARQRQRERFAEDGKGGHPSRPSAPTCNADMRPADVRKFCVLDETGQALMQAAMNQLQLSASGWPGRLPKMSIEKLPDAIEGLIQLLPCFCRKTQCFMTIRLMWHVTIIQRQFHAPAAARMICDKHRKTN
jgi:hypothetical protein